MEKITLQMISDNLAERKGLSKRTADTLAKAFFDTIISGLNADGIVKINGLGTFKIVEVADRESVNVNNGERIVIAGYKKVSFTPAVELSEIGESEAEVTGVADSSTAEDEDLDTTVEEDDVNSAVEEEDVNSLSLPIETESNPIEELILGTPEISVVEIPQNEFSNIDMLISTPESIEDVREQYEAAKKLAEETLEAAKAANSEKVRLEMLLERLEANTVPEVHEEVHESVAMNVVDTHEEIKSEGDAENEVTETESDESSNSEETPATEDASNTEEPSDEDADAKQKSKEALERFLNYKERMSDEDKLIEPQTDPKESKSISWYSYALTSVLIIVMVVVGFFTYAMYKSDLEMQAMLEEYNRQEKLNSYRKYTNHPAESSVAPDTVAEQRVEKAGTATEAKVEPAKEEKPADKVDKAQENTPKTQEKPKTYVVKPGETLTKISRKIYGTKDSVRAIIRCNKFKDPDNIPVGTTVNLP